MNIPENLYYSKEHEWVRFDGTKAFIGITDYAQSNLGDIVFVELPEIDTELGKMDEAGVVESVKAVSPVYSPVAGKITEVNEELLDAPESINEAPYDHYLFAVELADPSDKEGLLDATAYAKLCEE